MQTAEVSADVFDDAGISEEENNWPWRAVPGPSPRLCSATLTTVLSYASVRLHDVALVVQGA